MSRLFPDEYYKFSDEQKVEPHFKFEEEDFKKIEEMERRETKRRFDDAVRMLEARKRSARQSPRKAPPGFARLFQTGAGKSGQAPAGPRPPTEKIKPEPSVSRQKAASGQAVPAAAQVSRQGVRPAGQGGAVPASAGKQAPRSASPRMTNRAQLRLAQSPELAKAHSASPWKLQAAMLGLGLAAFAMTFAVCSRLLPRMAAF